MMSKCKHNLVQEMEWIIPNFWGQFAGEKKRQVPAGDGYLVCTKCEARGLHLGGGTIFIEEGNVISVQEI